MGEVVLLALSAAFNPTELAAVGVILLLPNPGRLLQGYWGGAMLTGTACGLAIVFALKGTGAEHTTRHTIGPLVWLVVAALLVIAAFALARGEDKRAAEHYRERHPKKEKKTPRWQKMLREGNAWHAFVAGVLLSFPGASYLAALDRIIHLHYAAAATVLVLVGFNLVQNLILEIPMLAFRIWPRQTPAAIESAKEWASTHGREYGAWTLGLLGIALAIPSVIALLSR
jgi:hypothetical protein